MVRRVRSSAVLVLAYAAENRSYLAELDDARERNEAREEEENRRQAEESQRRRRLAEAETAQRRARTDAQSGRCFSSISRESNLQRPIKVVVMKKNCKPLW